MLLAPLLALMAPVASADTPRLPTGIAGQLPPGHIVLASVTLTEGKTGRSFQIVALGRSDEDVQRQKSRAAPARPLFIFERRRGRFVAVGRNDDVVMRADEGGQCDPFLDGDATIAVKGRYFTVENGVACGQHWSDYISFRLDDRSGFVFDNERVESWTLNPSNNPDDEALVRDGPQRVRRDRPGHVTTFVTWRPSR